MYKWFNDKNVEITGPVSVKRRLQTIVFTMQMTVTTIVPLFSNSKNNSQQSAFYTAPNWDNFGWDGLKKTTGDPHTYTQLCYYDGLTTINTSVILLTE